jgi:Mycothiol maleylpyruvate isomerase N-terminal domain.
MATREELMGGFQFVPAQAKRVAGMLDGLSEWDTQRVQGWTPKEMFTHVAVTAGIIPTMGPAMLGAPPEADVVGGMDLAAVNQQGVESMAAMDTQQVLDTLSTNYVKLSDWVKGLSDEQLESKHTFLGMPITASDLIMTICVMHSVHHLYEAPLLVFV